MSTSDQRRLQTCSEAGARNGKSAETIRRLAASGQVRARKYGGRWFVDSDSVAAYLGGEQAART